MRKKQAGNLMTATGRAKLPQRREPHWVPVVRGFALGYRKGATGGFWIARIRQDDGKQAYHSLGAADDLNDGNGMSYEAALDEARKRFKTTPATGSGKHTVGDAFDNYLAAVRASSPASTVFDTEKRIESILRPAFGKLELVKLRSSHITRWRTTALKERKPDTVNRLVTILKAALNQAWREDGLISDDSEWRKVSRLEGGGSRKVFLSFAESRELVAKCKPEALAKLVQAALLTGARYGELVNLNVHDFDVNTGTIEIGSGKTGARTVYLSTEAIAFFSSIAIGRPSDALLLPREDGEKWGKNHHQKTFAAAVKAAKLKPDTTFYALRHTHISRAMLAKVNIQVLAENVGTSVRMIEKHYAKFLQEDRRAMFDKITGFMPEEVTERG